MAAALQVLAFEAQAAVIAFVVALKQAVGPRLGFVLRHAAPLEQTDPKKEPGNLLVAPRELRRAVRGANLCALDNAAHSDSIPARSAMV